MKDVWNFWKNSFGDGEIFIFGGMPPTHSYDMSCYVSDSNEKKNRTRTKVKVTFRFNSKEETLSLNKNFKHVN